MKRSKPLRRSPMPRPQREGPSTAPRETKPRAKDEPKFKRRPCEWERCGKVFTPKRPMQTICSPRCATARANAQVAERKAKERAADRNQREAMKTHGDLMAEAQDSFNAYIRYRDAGKGCIDCGRPFEPEKPGGSMDAGHFLPRSTSGHLRFNEDNVHGQRKNCNRPGGATRAAYRAGLVARIGEDRVQALEQDYTIRKFTKDDFREIRDTYRARLREMKKQQKE